MSLNLPLASVLLLTLSALAPACDSPQSSASSVLRLSEESPPGFPYMLPLHRPEDDEIAEVAGLIGYQATPQHPAPGACLGCHEAFMDVERLQILASKTMKAFICYAVPGEAGAETARKTLDCLAKLVENSEGTPADLGKLRARDLGFMAAGLAHPLLRKPFDDAGESEAFESLKKRAAMPPFGTAISDLDALSLVSWVMAGFPYIEKYVKHSGPSLCASQGETFVGPGVREHILRMSRDGEGWEAVNLLRGHSMFACPDFDKHRFFTQESAGVPIF